MSFYAEMLEKNTVERLALIKKLAAEQKVDPLVVATAILAAQVWELSCEVERK
jgi:hypothetical protein